MSNRDTLKLYFKSGKAPTERQFADLIDSVPNIEEDGVIRTEQDGVVFYPRKENGLLAAFYKEAIKNNGDVNPVPCWTLGIGKEKELLLKDENNKVIFSIEQDRLVSLYENREVITKPPVEEPKVEPELPLFIKLSANGHWHDLPVEEAIGKERYGCRVYRVFAVYQRGGKGCYRMVEVVASHCNGRKKQLVSSRKRWGYWRGPIRVRWNVREEGLFLQICGKRKDKAVIHCQIIKTWEYSDRNN